MDELDAEILALAGAETKPERLSPPTTTNGRKRSEPPTSVSPSRLKKSRTAPQKKSKKKSRRGDSEDEEEESELSDAPESEVSEEGEEDEDEDERPAPTRSTNNNTYASSSESSDDEGIFELYPYEGTYKDAADKAKLMAMSEVEREAVLAERATEIERAVQDRHLRTLLRSQSRNAAAAGKESGAGSGRGGNTSGGESGGGSITRRSTRTQTMPQTKKLDSKKGKLDEMKRAREERSTRKDKPSSTGDDELRKKSSIADDDDDDDRVEYANDLYEAKKEEREIELHDVNRARIGRTGFTKLCDYPGFEEAVIDCFVRVSLYDRDTGKNAYRVAQIKGIVTGKPYSLLDGRRRTDKHLQLVQGKAERTFPMDLMSDGAITEAEFNRFKAQLNVDSMPLPPLSLARKKANDLRELDSRTFTPEEISAMIAKRNKDKIDTVSLVVQRSQLKTKREEALLIGDQEEVWRIDKEIEAIDDLQRKAMRGTQPSDDAQAKLAKLNAAARARNREEIRKAELEEKRKARLAAMSDNKLTSEFYNPFQRVKTRAKVMHEDPDAKKVAAAASGDADGVSKATEGVAKTTLSGGATENSGSAVVPVSQKGGKKKGIDDVIASMDLGIEIDI
ncbi:hypothetical protein BDZ91DRAFT_772767 [Kalaharituber pfeilii]|nr:hypothetical protein BDZ91DRAFT_772767 [Kalaharituber pfeilii]